MLFTCVNTTYTVSDTVVDIVTVSVSKIRYACIMIYTLSARLAIWLCTECWASVKDIGIFILKHAATSFVPSCQAAFVPILQ